MWVDNLVMDNLKKKKNQSDENSFLKTYALT